MFQLKYFLKVSTAIIYSLFVYAEVSVTVVALHRSRTQPQLTAVGHVDHAHSDHAHSSTQHMDTRSTPTNPSCML